jgi:hypothetical protein
LPKTPKLEIKKNRCIAAVFVFIHSRNFKPYGVVTLMVTLLSLPMKLWVNYPSVTEIVAKWATVGI